MADIKTQAGLQEFPTCRSRRSNVASSYFWLLAVTAMLPLTEFFFGSIIFVPRVYALSMTGSRQNANIPTTALSSATTETTETHEKMTMLPTARRSLVTVIAEDVWRKAAQDHHQQIQTLLDPGLVDLDHPLMRPVLRNFKQLDEDAKLMTMLDPKHPIYNFLVEYYGLKGLKGPKRLARWSPSVGLFFWESNVGDNNNGIGNNVHNDDSIVSTRRIDSLDEYYMASKTYLDWDTNDLCEITNGQDEIDRRIFLEGATPDDFALTLYLQGAQWVEADESNNEKGGILYRPIRYYNLVNENGNTNNAMEMQHQKQETQNENASSLNDDKLTQKKASSFLWYKSILETTLGNEAVLHCYGLHEWAMQYQPEGAPPPPSGKYQAHLPLRVPREVINSTVERKGLRCTHVDALRFFAPAAGPLNYHGGSLERNDQLVLEQPGCVHAHMDLLKIALRIKPYCDPSLLVDVLRVALASRTLDVGASPYDCTAYSGDNEGTPIRVIPVETTEGRALYKNLQTELMAKAEVVRKRLLMNYEAFGMLAFSNDQLETARNDPSDERFAKAEPGGRAWRHNLIDRPESIKAKIEQTKG